MLSMQIHYFVDDNDDDGEVQGHEEHEQNYFMQYIGNVESYFHLLTKDFSSLLCR